MKELKFTDRPALCFKCNKPAIRFYAITKYPLEGWVFVPACRYHFLNGKKRVLVEIIEEDDAGGSTQKKARTL